MSEIKEFVVFYAWQSDADQRFNRHLIRTDVGAFR